MDPQDRTDGILLRALVETPGFDPVRTWGPDPLLLIKPVSQEGTSPFQFDTPDPPGGTETVLNTTVDMHSFRSTFLAPGSAVVPVKKSPRNQWSHITIGRARNNDIRVADKGVSKVHAYFFPPPAWPMFDDGPWRLQDCHSTNGTEVFLGSGSQRVPSVGGGVHIQIGTPIRIGSVYALFCDGESLRALVEVAKRQWTEEDRTNKSDDTDKITRD